MADVQPDWRPATEGGIGRKKPQRGWRRRGRKMATREEWAAIRARKASAGCRLNPRECVGQAWRVEFHHLVPRSLGGDDVPDNLVPLCASCHYRVTNRNARPLAALAASLTDSEYAYVIGKLGEGALERLFGVAR